MEAFKECLVCFQNYNTKERTPRSLPCGHSLCSECLTQIVNSAPQLRKCPLDQSFFNDSQTSLKSFPLNFAVMAYLELKNKNVCGIHPEKKLKWICVTDQIKICSECAKHEHQEHRRKKIKELKANGGKVKKDLEEAYLKIQQYEENEENDYEQIKKVFISQVDEQFKKIKNVLVKKEIEFKQQANNLFSVDTNTDSESLFTLKQQMKETINDITYAYRDDKNIMILDKDFNSSEIITKSNSLVEKSSQIHQKACEMQKTLQGFLMTSKAALNSVRISSNKISSAELFPEEFNMAIKFQSYFDIKNTEEGLKISARRSESKEIEINLGEFQAIETIDIEFLRYDMLNKEPNPSIISYLLNGLEKLNSLDLLLAPTGFNNDALLWIGNIISDHAPYLKSLYIGLEKCKLTNQSTKSLFEIILPKMMNLQELYLQLDSSGFTNSGVELLVKALRPFCKNLECFAISLDNNKITEDGVDKIFQIIKYMENLKYLKLFLSKIGVTDRNLELFGERVLPCLKVLGSLSLCMDRCQISDDGILSVLEHLPRLKKLALYMCHTEVTDKTSEEFLERVLPRLEDSLESLTFAAIDAYIKREHLERINSFSESLKEKKAGDSQEN